MNPPLQSAIVGPNGYTGLELQKILARHPHVASPILFTRSTSEESATTQPFSWEAVQETGTSLLFLATPHEFSRDFVPEAASRGIRVVDLSGAWRLKSAANRSVYAFANNATNTLDEQAVYGLPELHRERIRQATLVANPGCYPTSIILATAPLLKAGLVDVTAGVICDAKSGVSGAGKAVKPELHFMAITDNFRAYNPTTHRHRGELMEQLNITADQLTFTPHLLPIARGMFSTIYLRMKATTSATQIADTLRAFHETSPFVRILGRDQIPEIAAVTHTNFCNIGFALSADGLRLTLFSCIDNLVKGASGQAVQNMNLMCGWDETEGLQ